jgi:1,4-alpha-glucan branching enzyme
VIRRNSEARTGAVKITFAIDGDLGPASVVGDFNGWDAAQHPLVRRSNGTRSVSVALPAHAEFRFRYVDLGGRFFDDVLADGLEPNGFGETHSILRT